MKELLFHKLVTPLWVQATGGVGIETAVKKVVSRAIQNGRQVFQSVFQTTEKVGLREIPKTCNVQNNVPLSTKPSIQRAVFDGLFPRVSIRTVAAELRRRAALQGISGGIRQSANGRYLPLFAFIGVGISSFEDNENENASNICSNIRDACKSFDLPSTYNKPFKPSAFCLDDLELGSFIAKGCNAAVYEARYKQNQSEHVEINQSEHAENNQSETEVEEVKTEFMPSSQPGELNNKSNSNESVLMDLSPDCESGDFSVNSMVSDSDSIEILERDDDVDFVTFVQNESQDADGQPLVFDDDVDFVTFVQDESQDADGQPLECDDDVDFVTFVQEESQDADGQPLVFDDDDSDIFVLGIDLDEEDFLLQDVENPEKHKPPDVCCDLAVKMMFNYDAESNTIAISQAMKKETIPAKMRIDQESLNIINFNESEQPCHLPPHPNIVDMKEVFIGDVPDIPDASVKYPAALPTRLHDNGLGRNMTMFLVMKRYTCTLREYLSENDLDMTTKLFLLAQLLEGVEHLNFHGIAHRDLKSNNILIDCTKGMPALVISDFGCCLADEEYGLKIPYITNEQSKGGNPSLMAPEIACATPSRSGRAVLDYGKSDLWAVGTLAYEIFGLENPFSGQTGSKCLNSSLYQMSDLPTLPDAVPDVIQNLVYKILDRDPQQRPSLAAAASVVEFYIWSQLKDDSTNCPTIFDLTSWLLIIFTEVFAKTIFKISTDDPELQLKYSLLMRTTQKDLFDCVNFYKQYL
ncbi:serine/threonine-protein kinase Pink1, mitochondrial [Patella vulgata]|uniref:serine/threonine-protein kinase Pink1, mitochondrial n=1 Tax=Patella vulgata TaxID=6465 RepID=UPI0021802705|nr:serine/threonine-protein kinase Pink1, mitochondrial [Patella vulgata]